MKNFHVAVIVGAAVIILYLFWQDNNQCAPNVATFRKQGPLQCGGNLNTGPVT